jgi:hypothetical protein
MADVAELTPKELDLQRMIAAEVHIGTKIATDLMKDYVWVRRHDSASFDPLFVASAVRLCVCLLCAAVIMRAFAGQRSRYSRRFSRNAPLAALAASSCCAQTCT